MKLTARRNMCGRAVEKGIRKAVCATLLPLILFACIRQGLLPPGTTAAPLSSFSQAAMCSSVSCGYSYYGRIFIGPEF